MAGRWGSFIGGSSGNDSLDLTECPEGRLLNEECGWDYDDPRHWINLKYYLIKFGKYLWKGNDLKWN